MATRDLAKEVESLTASLAEIRRSLEDLPDQLSDAAAVGRRQLRRAGRVVSHAADDVADRTLEGIDVLESGIETRPLLAVGLAFLAGMAVDRFLLR